MKLGRLRSVGHNIADSLASGIGLPIGWFETAVFQEAAHNPNRRVTIDFLAGQCIEGTISPRLTRAVKLYVKALDSLCRRHNIATAAFSELTVTYMSDPRWGHFLVTVADQHGHRCIDEYQGVPGRRVRLLDRLGRVRRKPPIRQTVVAP